jgi:hypothetical protein
MSKIYLFITGPIRPSLDFVIDNIINIKQKFLNPSIHILYWDNSDIDKTKLEKYCDKVYAITEPTDDYIYNSIKERTQQQLMIKTIEHWTLTIYKMFYAIRNIVNLSQIKDNDIIIRFRTDLYIQSVNNISNLLMNIQPNSYYFCPKISCGNSCDWFGISDFNTFKKIWYIKDDETYNNIIKQSWNAENILIDNAKRNNIVLININVLIKMAICRDYKNNVLTLDIRH